MGDNNSNQDYINAYKNYFDKQIRYENIITSKQHINTNIRLNGVIGYVTNTGVFKRYNNPDGLETSYQILGCPLSGTILDVSDSMFDQNLTNANVGDIGEKFVIGENMETGSACGNAGNIVKVTSLLPSNLREPTFKKCSNVAPGNEVAKTGGAAWSFDSCKLAAVEAGYRFFGISSDKCYTGNNVDDSSNISEPYDKITVLWSSDSKVVIPFEPTNVSLPTITVNNKAYMTKYGTLEIANNSGDVLFSTNKKSRRAKYDGGINMVKNASYGNQRCGVTTKALSNKLRDRLPTSSTETMYEMDIGLTDEFLEIDPSKPRPGLPECNDRFTLKYNCGSRRRYVNLPDAYGQTLMLQCKEDGGKHNVFLLPERGIPRIFVMKISDTDRTDYLKFSRRNVYEYVWRMPMSTRLRSQRKDVNQSWIDGNKYSRDFLIMGDSLGPGEWISRKDGKLRLIMTKSGNLELQTSYKTTGCEPLRRKIGADTQDGVTLFGIDDSHTAVYELDFIAKPSRSALGKIAYIDDNNNAHEYVGNMLGADGTPVSMIDTRCPGVANMVNIDSSTYESYKKVDNATLDTTCGSETLFIDNIDRINQINTLRNDRDNAIVENMRANLVSAHPNLEQAVRDPLTVPVPVEGFVNSGDQFKPEPESRDANMRDAIILNKIAVTDYKFWWLIVLYLICVALIIGNIESDKTKLKYSGLLTLCVVYYYYASTIEFNILNNTNAMIKLIGITIHASLAIYTINKTLS